MYRHERDFFDVKQKIKRNLVKHVYLSKNSKQPHYSCAVVHFALTKIRLLPLIKQQAARDYHSSVVKRGLVYYTTTFSNNTTAADCKMLNPYAQR